MGGWVARKGAREAPRLHSHHAALPARDARDMPVAACDVSVVTIMVAVPPRVVAGVIGAGMAPCAVMRSRRSRSGRYRDSHRRQRQRDETKRPTERNQLNHTQSSLAPPIPQRPQQTTAGLRFAILDMATERRDAAMRKRFRGHSAK